MTKGAILLAALLLLGGAKPPKPSWMAKFEARAMPYLDPRIQPRPKYPPSVPEEEKMHWGRTDVYRSKKCWGVRDGVVCSACYDNAENYLAQAEVLCPWNTTDCRYIGTAEEIRRYRIDLNQCFMGRP